MEGVGEVGCPRDGRKWNVFGERWCLRKVECCLGRSGAFEERWCVGEVECVRSGGGFAHATIGRQAAAIRRCLMVLCMVHLLNSAVPNVLVVNQ